MLTEVGEGMLVIKHLCKRVHPTEFSPIGLNLKLLKRGQNIPTISSERPRSVTVLGHIQAPLR